jgi:tetratricopeptide (TPR) repeat protein
MFFMGGSDTGGRPALVASAPQSTARLSVEGLQSHLRATPDDWQAWARLGVAYVEQARVSANPALYPKAEGAFERSLDLRPERNVDALIGRAALANARHDFAGGLQWADKARSVDPGRAQANGVVGDSLVELGRYEEAFGAYQRMVDLGPGLASYTRAAYALELQGDVPGARRTLELALGEAVSPTDMAFAHHSLGELAWNNGDVDSARRHYEDATRLDPGFVPPAAGLARVHAAAGEGERAVRAWQQVVSRAPTPEYVAELGNLYTSLGRHTEAADQFDLLAAQRQLLRADGVNVDLELALFSADHAIDLPDGLEAAQSEWGRSSSIHVADALAWQLHAHGRHAEALALADQALRLGTRNAAFFYHRGMIRHSLGHVAAARADLEQALAINPNFSPLGARRASQALIVLEAG